MDAPEQGQLVRVRNRHYLVNDVSSSGDDRDLVHAGHADVDIQHVRTPGDLSLGEIDGEFVIALGQRGREFLVSRRVDLLADHDEWSVNPDDDVLTLAFQNGVHVTSEFSYIVW